MYKSLSILMYIKLHSKLYFVLYYNSLGFIIVRISKLVTLQNNSVHVAIIDTFLKNFSRT